MNSTRTHLPSKLSVGIAVFRGVYFCAASVGGSGDWSSSGRSLELERTDASCVEAGYKLWDCCADEEQDGKCSSTEISASEDC